ncbi:hypothetical protein FDK21_04940 [Cohaesibacter sp. CAU 1516]|uniref:hypothetical protein n=1 Tax=Cohaesibacter sp. CAU 1516 TaxID=2576038 RepID=UPI0010FE0993|nr:hypothetical protein [Cohaesibacter sp. CAU 1516]TLP48993.1 hypothetical protein FDK21_04940 [Cohaesibacter sp. CAU 1516]
MIDENLLEPDCSKCAALCCVSLAFDKSDMFPIDKPNGAPCPQLDKNNGCKIYDCREAEGYHGCMNFNCQGAGQRVVQDLFGGRNWHFEQSLLNDMTSAFVILLRAHELLSLLKAAEALPLTRGELDQFEGFVEELNPEDGWTEALLEAFEKGKTEKRVYAFLKSLRHHVA